MNGRDLIAAFFSSCRICAGCTQSPARHGLSVRVLTERTWYCKWELKYQYIQIQVLRQWKTTSHFILFSLFLMNKALFISFSVLYSRDYNRSMVSFSSYFCLPIFIYLVLVLLIKTRKMNLHIFVHVEYSEYI